MSELHASITLIGTFARRSEEKKEERRKKRKAGPGRELRSGVFSKRNLPHRPSRHPAAFEINKRTMGKIRRRQKPVKIAKESSRARPTRSQWPTERARLSSAAVHFVPLKKWNPADLAVALPQSQLQMQLRLLLPLLRPLQHWWSFLLTAVKL